MKTFNVITTAQTSTSSEELENKSFDTLEEATAFFDEEIKKESDEHGVEIEMSIYCEDELIKNDCKISKSISNEAIIVTYQHVGKGMGYAYEIKHIEKSFNQKYSDLCENKDQRFSSCDTVFDNIEDLKDSYENGYGIMGKINKGRSVVEAFLSENKIEGYDESEEE